MNKKYKCNNCDISFNNYTSLKMHHDLYHKTKEKLKEFQCDKCDKSFNKYTSLQSHKKQYHKKKDYKDFYDIETKLMVQEMYADDLQTFNYKF